MTTFAPALHLQNDNIHTKIKAQMIIKDPGSSITHFIGMLCAIAGLFPLILKAASYGCLLYTSDAADVESRGLGDVYKRQFNDCIYGKYDSSICSKHNLSHI